MNGVGGSVLREWILEVREVKSEMEIWFTHFEKWKVKWKFGSLISRMKSEMKMPWYRDREWKVKWKCLKIEIESEKWIENASRSRSRSEISREFSRNFENFLRIKKSRNFSNFVTNAFRPEVHPIHPVQSTYGFWAFKPAYTDFRSIWASQLQSMAVWSLLIVFIIIILTRKVLKTRITIMKLLHFCVIHNQIFWFFHDKTCIIHSFFSRKRVKSEMLSLISRSEKWNENLVHSFREWKVKWKCLEIEIESEKWNENASRSRSEIGKKFSRILEKRDSRWLLVQNDDYDKLL